MIQKEKFSRIILDAVENRYFTNDRQINLRMSKFLSNKRKGTAMSMTILKQINL